MIRRFLKLLGDAESSYSRHGGPMLSAAVAFSSLLSIAPLLFIALSIAGLVVGDAGRASVMQDLSRWIGDDGAHAIGLLLEKATHPTQVTIAYAAILVYASTGMFSQMKRTLNQLWGIQAKSSETIHHIVWKQLRKRATALALVVFVGVLIVSVVAVKTVLTAAASNDTVEWIGELAISIVTTTIMFATLFKVLPDAVLHWRDAVRGALVTSLLFSIGTTLISLYLGHEGLDAQYGPGASVVLLLLWVHYSAQVFFFGAALTASIAEHGGRAIVPDDHGVAIVAVHESV